MEYDILCCKKLRILKMKKLTITPLVHRLIFTLLVNVGMAFAMSLSMHLINIGAHNFFDIWLKNFATSMVIGFPIALILVTLVGRMLEWFFTVNSN